MCLAGAFGLWWNGNREMPHTPVRGSWQVHGSDAGRVQAWGSRPVGGGAGRAVVG
jgi:hypothetical protein